MRTTVIGFVTFGNIEFTKLTIQGIKDTVKNPYDLFVVVGKPGDTETIEYLENQNIPHVVHEDNYGFPYSVNDLYDYAWVHNNYDNLVILGNDVICYPHAVDNLIELAEETDYLVISALQYDVRDLVREFPETLEHFSTGSYNFINFGGAEPWKLAENLSFKEPQLLADMQLFDIQNLCLYKREAFEIIGYTDVNFYPAYYIDNDYARRIVNSEIKCCSLVNSRFFHFWSRTIHQGSGGSNSRYFSNNRKYYIEKWGGDFGRETKEAPVGIFSREYELEAIDFWKKQ